MPHVIHKPLVAQPEDGYALLDTGDGQKLEQYGAYTLARPDPQVLWAKHTPSLWVGADASYERKNGDTKGDAPWKKSPRLPNEWRMTYGGSTFIVKPTNFKHTGIFPEQAVHWRYIADKIQDARTPSFRLLNLFAYTGGASLAAARGGAEVTHVDASKVANVWAKENAVVSGLGEATIRYITDDVLQFVKREIRRGNHYHGIVMDPPAFGRGVKGEVWKIEENLDELVGLCEKLLAPGASFMLMSGYAAGYAPRGFANLMLQVTTTRGGTITCGELGIEEKTEGSRVPRVLPTGMYAKWEALATNT